MVAFDIKISGDKELEQALSSLIPKLEKKVLLQAMRKAAKPIQQQAQANVKAIRVTGETTDKIILSVRALKRRRGRFGVAVQTPERSKLGIGADDKWYPPAHIELGAPSRGLPAQPFLRSALEDHRKSSSKIMRDEILAGIERIARSG